jgi:hypothetical protein
MADTSHAPRVLYIVTRSPEEDAPALFGAGSASDDIFFVVTDPGLITPQLDGRNISLLRGHSCKDGATSAYPLVTSEEMLGMMFAADHVVVL